MQIKDFFKGLGYFVSSMGYLRKHGMGKIYWWMLGVGILFLAIYMFGVSKLSGYIEGVLGDYISSFEWPEWVNYTLGWLISLLVFVACALIYHLINGTILLILLSPLFSHIAYKAVSIEMGEAPKQLTLWKSISRGVMFALRNFVIQVILWIALYAISFIVPIISPVVPFAIIAVNAFYYAVSMADYTMELKGYNVNESAHYGRIYRVMLCGIGLPFTLVLMIPLVGSYFAIILAPVVEIGAMRMCLEQPMKE